MLNTATAHSNISSVDAKTPGWEVMKSPLSQVHKGNDKLLKNASYNLKKKFLLVNRCTICHRVSGHLSVLGIVFVGQREVFVCLDFVLTFFSLAAKLIGLLMGRQFFKNVDFAVT